MIPVSIGMPYIVESVRPMMKWKAPIPPGTGEGYAIIAVRRDFNN